MIQLKSTDSLQVLLAGAITTSQGVLYATFADIATDGSTFAPSPSSGATNSTTAVDWVAAPASGRRVVKYLSLYNADTVDMVATVRVVDNGTNRILGKFTLAAGERLEYADGFQVASVGGATVSSVNGDTGAVIVGTPIIVACSDETTALTAGTAKLTFRMPYAFTLTGIRASLTTAQASGSIFTVDVNEGGASILSTLITIDNTETTSTTASTPPVLSDTALADDAVITVDIDQIGDGTAAGLKVTLLGYAA